MATLPLQAPGPGPTDQALPDYLSYSPVATTTQTFTQTQTRIVYDPQGSFAPYQTVDVVTGTTRIVDYSVVNVPLLYTGPFPAPPLGTLYTTPGQSIPIPASSEASQSQTNEPSQTASATAPATATSPQDTPTGAPTAAPTAPPSPSVSASNSAPTPAASSAPDASASASAASASDASVASVASEASVASVASVASASSASAASTSASGSVASSASAASASSASASASSASASSASASSTIPPSSTSGVAPEPSASAASLPNARNNLSGGQIAGMVVGSVLGLLLLLLLLLCCLRRRRKQRQNAGYAAPGTGAGAGAGAAGAGAATPRSRLKSAFTRGGGRGNYAAVGAGAAAGAGAGALAAGAAGRRGSLDSDEWEEDHLSGGGGSGFFVVGGKRQSSPRRASLIGRRGTGLDPSTAYDTRDDPEFNMANAAPSASNGGKANGPSKTALSGLGLGGGLLAAAFGRKKGDKGKQRATYRDADDDWEGTGGQHSDEDGPDGEMAERRGLMDFRAVSGADGATAGSQTAPEMREVGSGPASSWHPDGRTAGLGAAAIGAGAAAGAYAATRDGSGSQGSSSGTTAGPSDRERQHRNASSAGGSRQTVQGGSRPTSGTYSGSGNNSSGYGRGGTPSPNIDSTAVFGDRGGSSSNSTGGHTGSGSGTSLSPPPRAPRVHTLSQTLGNLAPSGAAIGAAADGAAPVPSASGDALPRISTETSSSGASGHGGLNPALLGVGGAAALGGLGALAAGHRESGGSTYSKGYYPSGVPPGAAGSPGEGDLAGGQRAGESNDEASGGEKLGHFQPSDPERYSRFISSDTPLLGPGFAGDGAQQADATRPAHTHGDNDQKGQEGSRSQTPEHQSNVYPAVGTLGVAGTGFQRGRLPTIPSVGEFGERSGSESLLNGGTSRSSELRSFNTGSGGSHDASGSSGRGPRGLPIYEEHQTMGGETLPAYHTAQAPTEQVQSPAAESAAGFHTPFDSPRTNPGAAPSLLSLESHTQKRGPSGGRFSVDVGRSTEAESEAPFSDGDRTSADVQRNFSLDQPANVRAGLMSGDDRDTGNAAAGAGILGGMAAGWRRLTMGQYGWLPGNSGGERSGDRDDLEEGGTSFDGSSRRDASGGSGQTAADEAAAAAAANVEAGPFSDVQSEHASVYNPSALGHGSQGTPVTNLHSSREASLGSGERSQHSGALGLAAGGGASGEFGRRGQGDPSIGSVSGSGHSSSQSRRGGYAASVSNSSLSGGARRSGSVSTGLDSLSQVAQLSSSNTGSSGSRSGYGSSRRGGRSGGPSEVSLSGASTGAASYSPSGVNLTRGNTSSTRGGDSYAQTSLASYNPSRRSGESASILTDAADAGWESSEAQSSRATQGANSSLERRKRPRSNSADGLRRLSSLREVGEADPFGDPSSPLPPSGGPSQPQRGHYPSPSLGDAVIRSAYRQMGPTAVPASQRPVFRSLQPGVSAPAPAALAGSSSAPSLASPSRGGDGAQQQQPGDPTAASWRPSPRVASAAQRAAEAQVRASSSSSAVPAQGDVEAARGDGGQEDEEPQGASSRWPKFLRF